MEISNIRAFRDGFLFEKSDRGSYLKTRALLPDRFISNIKIESRQNIRLFSRRRAGGTGRTLSRPNSYESVRPKFTIFLRDVSIFIVFS